MSKFTCWIQIKMWKVCLCTFMFPPSCKSFQQWSSWPKKKKERKRESASFTLLFSRSVVSDSLWPHGLQRARLPCPSPFPEACSNSCPSSQWCHLTISFSVICFSSYLQSFPAPLSLSMSWLSASGGQSIGASASASVLSMNIPFNDYSFSDFL